MKFDEFKEKVKKEIQEYFQDQCEIRIEKIVNNDGVLKTAMYLKRADQNVSPVCWLNDEYSQFIKEGEDQSAWFSCIKRLKEAFLSVQEDMAQKLAEKLPDYRKIQDQIVYRLIRKEDKEKFLENVPYLSFLDLAIVFYILETDGSGNSYYCLIRKDLMRAWKVSILELMERAEKNTPHLLPPRTFRFSDFGLLDTSVPVKILTNESLIYGAATVLYKGVLEKLSEETGTDLILIPSSVHEVLILPDTNEIEAEELAETIKQVNDKELEPQEILSGHPYRFVRETGTLKMM